MSLGDNILDYVDQIELPLLVRCFCGSGSTFLTAALNRKGLSALHNKRSGPIPDVVVGWKHETPEAFTTHWLVVRHPLRTVYSAAVVLTELARNLRMDPYVLAARYLVDFYSEYHTLNCFRLEDAIPGPQDEYERNRHALRRASAQELWEFGIQSTHTEWSRIRSDLEFWMAHFDYVGE